MMTQAMRGDARRMTAEEARHVVAAIAPVTLDGGVRLSVELRLRGRTPIAVESARSCRTWMVRADDGEVVFVGGVTGEHGLSILASNAERIYAHWDGYVQSNREAVARTKEGVR